MKPNLSLRDMLAVSSTDVTTAPNSHVARANNLGFQICGMTRNQAEAF
jgi:hypothetical protein